MSEALVTALIAGGVSVLVSLLGFWGANRSLRAQNDRFRKELDSKWTDKVYQERLARYPEAFRLTSRIQQVKAPIYLPSVEIMDDIKKELNAWAAEAGLFMSRDTAKAYMDLRRALAKNPGDGVGYAEGQAKKIWRLRNDFRRGLRKDIGNVYVDDDNSESASYWEVL